MVLLFNFIDKMYMFEALISGLPDAEISPDVIGDAYWYHKINDAGLILTWCSLVAVKFCFLILFKKLIDRLRPMIIYWWAVPGFNGLLSAYGVSAFIAACPYFDSPRACEFCLSWPVRE